MKRQIYALCAALIVLSSTPAFSQSKSFTLGKWVEVHNAILKELNRSYVDSLEIGRIEREAVDAMLGALDPYTVYVPEEEQEDFQMMLNSAYGGIGAIIYKPQLDGNVIINEPYANSPAAKSGLRCGDEILEVDGVSTHGLTSTESSERMRGKPGTTVSFKVKKVYTGEILDINVTRERIVLPSVEYSGLLENG
ncbi:MAG: PDZ domain-containing protein, partial [Bacteroidales bacterium]|nr:PDZ domain-containing protein [Bacteroidales bacterium]